MKPLPIVMSAPSGGGKTTVAKMLLARRTDVGYSVSCTTRDRRPGEVDGHDYHFLAVAEFGRRRDAGEFAEYAEVHGRMYGTLRSEVESVLASGRHVLMDIDVQGARQFRKAFPDSVLIFLLPPSIDILLSRLRARGSESPDALRIRVGGALEELRAAREYAYLVVNDDLDRAYGRVSSIIDAEAVRHGGPELLENLVAPLAADLEHRLRAGL